MRKTLLTAILAFAAALAPVHTRAGCLTTTGPLALSKIRLGDPGSVWVGCVNDSFDKLSSSAAVNGSTTTTLFNGGVYTPFIGGISTGWNGVKMSSYTFFASSTAFLYTSGYSVTTSSGIDVRLGTLKLEAASSGLDATGTGITAAMGAFSGVLSAGSFVGPVAPAGVDFSTITAALGGKLDKTGGTLSGDVAGKTVTLSGGVTAATATLTTLNGASAGFSGGLTASSGTFTATGAAQYSLQTSSGLSIATGQVLLGAGSYIQWPDGSKSTTSAGGGAGGGGNVFTSSITVGSQVQSSSITANAVIIGGMAIVGYSSFTTATSQYFYLFQASTTYVVHIDMVPSTATQFSMTINDTTGVNDYAYYNRCQNSVGTTLNAGGDATNPIKLQGSTNIAGFNTNGAGAGYTGSFEMTLNPGKTMIYAYGAASYLGSADADITGCSLHWGSSRITPTVPFNLKFSVSSGSMKGRIWIEQKTMMQAY